MKILNLVDIQVSDLKYHIDIFPDSQPHLVFEKGWNKFKWNDKKVKIITRISNLTDLFILRQAVQILRHEVVEITEIFISYLLCGRTERRFSMDEAIDLDLVRQDLKSLACKICVLEPHVERPEYKGKYLPLRSCISDYRAVIMFPDKGAYMRYESLGANVYFEKERSDSGEIELKLIGRPLTIDYDDTIVIVDDLCDGGNTFCAIADKLNEFYPNVEKVLMVTHAIQLKGIERVAEKFDDVFITNSFTEWSKIELPKNVHVIRVI